MFRSKEFQRSILPLIIFNSVIGTGLLEYSVNRIFRKIGYAYAICCLVYYVILFVTFMNMLSVFADFEKTEMTKILTKFQFFMNVFFYVVSFAAGLTRNKRMKLLMQQLETCTERIREMNETKDYYYLFRYQCFASAFLIFAIICLLVIDTNYYLVNLSLDYHLMIHYCYFDNYPTIVTMIVIFSFVFWVRFIKIKFSQLNNILKKMLKTTVNSPQHKKVFQMKDMYNWEHDPSLITIYRTYEANENCKKLKKIKQIHLELIKCAKIINEAYGLQILLSAAWSVIFITTLLHNFYPVLLENKYHNWVKEFNSQFYWISLFSGQIFVITNICETTMMENAPSPLIKLCEMIIQHHVLTLFIFLYVENTGDILFELHEPSTSNKFRKEIHNFTSQLALNPLTFTACGFFDLNHTFIYSAIGSITTYLVILIQVGDKPKEFYNNTNYNSTSMTI